MDDRLFGELIDSVGEAGEIRRTTPKPRYIAWYGGECVCFEYCPVSWGDMVERVYRDGRVFQALAIMACAWRHDGTKDDIIAYRVIEQE